MTIIVCLLSKSYGVSSALQIILFHTAIWWMSRDVAFVINGRTRVNRRSLMMYSSVTFMILVSVIFAIRIATVPNNFSCDILRNQTSQAINYITLAYPRSQIKNRYEHTQLNNIINGKMSNIIWITTVTWANTTGQQNKIIITDGSSWLYISDLTGTKPLTEQKQLAPKSTPQTETNDANDALKNLSPDTNENINSNNENTDNANILDNLTHNAADISWEEDTWILAPQWILWKLEFYENMIINNVVNDKSLVDKWICEYTFEQVKTRQKHPEFLISSIILLFAILYPFFRFIFYIVGFIWRLLLLILSKFWIYNIAAYYQKVEKIE